MSSKVKRQTGEKALEKVDNRKLVDWEDHNAFLWGHWDRVVSSHFHILSLPPHTAHNSKNEFLCKFSCETFLLITSAASFYISVLGCFKHLISEDLISCLQTAA